MSKRELVFGTHFHNIPSFEEKLQKSDRLMMFGHKVATLSKEELLACIVIVQEERDAIQAQYDALEKKVALYHNS
jgi:hypothetical protein